MQALRQLGVGVLIALASVILVLGGIFLSLAETLPAPATPTQIPPTLPLNFPTPTATNTPLLQIETATIVTETASPSATTVVLVPPTSCTVPSGWQRVVPSAGDTIYSLAQRYKTSAESLSAANCLASFDLAAGIALYVPPVPTVTIIPCGPPAGWVRGHIVRPGDTLYRIALSYGITVQQLQRANCMGSSTTIYSGQRLWVPNIVTRTPVPGVTFVPDFPTETSLPTFTSVPPVTPPTATDPPTAVPTFTNTPVTPPPQ